MNPTDQNPTAPPGEFGVNPIPNPPPAIPAEPFFDYADFFLFVGLSIPCLLIAALLVRGLRWLVPLREPIRLLLAQSIWYFLAFGCLAALFRFRYDRPFWRSLGWRPISVGAAAGAILAGPFLALVVGLLGSALRSPEINLPFEQMLGSTSTKVLLGILVVILGPVAEELAFRGFLMPLLMRSLGPATGVILTGVIFGSVHGYEYQWSWQYMSLISLAGCVFGWARYKTGSTVASSLMHSTFNLMQFAAFLVQSRTL
ncbi:MAG TPA: type II CAAX endopeptidase family protein [Bryobacteraceae bacterium]|nr:type II CAAX endopeptidase family protein [Bryobacteraceae bacterium]